MTLLDNLTHIFLLAALAIVVIGYAVQVVLLFKRPIRSPMTVGLNKAFLNYHHSTKPLCDSKEAELRAYFYAGRKSGLDEAAIYVRWKMESKGANIAPASKVAYEESIITILTADMPRSSVEGIGDAKIQQG